MNAIALTTLNGKVEIEIYRLVFTKDNNEVKLTVLDGNGAEVPDAQGIFKFDFFQFQRSSPIQGTIQLTNWNTSKDIEDTLIHLKVWYLDVFDSKMTVTGIFLCEEYPDVEDTVCQEEDSLSNASDDTAVEEVENETPTIEDAPLEESSSEEASTEEVEVNSEALESTKQESNAQAKTNQANTTRKKAKAAPRKKTPAKRKTPPKKRK